MAIVFTCYADTPEQLKTCLRKELERRMHAHNNDQLARITVKQQRDSASRASELQCIIRMLDNLTIYPAKEE